MTGKIRFIKLVGWGILYFYFPSYLFLRFEFFFQSLCPSTGDKSIVFQLGYDLLKVLEIFPMQKQKNWSRDSNVEHSLDGNIFVRDPSLSVCGYEICRLIQAFAIRQTRLYFAWKGATSFYVKGKDCRQVRRRHVVTSSVLAKDNSIQFCLFWSLKRAGDWRCEREERALCESKCNPRGWATSIKT